ncbi:extracellular solute-binding protein, partial [Paenibacillus sepulcri]|nr:extracellular solute-binding protein [Paenibacillus sepulcri]
SSPPNQTGTGTDPQSPPAEGKATIVFSTFWEDANLQGAVKKYEALHPNVDIDLKYVKTDNEHFTADLEKFVETSNTSMLAGKGPDLIMMDDLPIDKYVDHKLLADLNLMMQQDSGFPEEDYFTNILDKLKLDGGLYGMPLSFQLHALVSDSEAISQSGIKVDDKNWTWSQFAESAKQIKEKGSDKNKIGFGGTPNYMLLQMVNDNYSRFVDRTKRQANFDSESFTGLMQQVKTLFDDGVIGPGVLGANGSFSYFNQSQFNSPSDYLVSLKEFGEGARLYVTPHTQDAGNGGYFTPYRSIGMNASSSVKPEAWEFIKFLISEEGQTRTNLQSAGFSFNKNVFKKQIQQLKDAGTVQPDKEGPLQGKPFAVDAAALDQLDAIVNGEFHSAAPKSSQIEDTIIQESEAFFTGQKTAQDVAKLIQNKVTLFLNE